MKKTIAGIALLSCVVASDLSGADQLTTGFTAVVSIGESVSSLAIPTGAGKKLILPSFLDDWECEVTPAFISDDGKEAYHNIVCTNIVTSLVLGITTSCPRFSTGYDRKAFFLRQSKNSVGFEMTCKTYQAGTKTQPSLTSGTTL